MISSAHPPTARKKLHLALPVALLPLIAACVDAPPGAEMGPPASAGSTADLRPYVSGEAAANVVSGTRFARVAQPEAGGAELISPQRAGELALADARTFGPFILRAWERSHGKPIDLTALRVHPAIYFASTPYGEFPEGYHPAFRTAYGPYYLVRLVDGAGRTVLVSAVSAYAHNLSVDDHGRLRLPVHHGNEVVVAPVPVDSTRWSPRTPEFAARLAASRTGARVTRTPELVLVGRPYHPYWAAWKITLERPVSVRGANGRRTLTTQLYVTPQGRLWAAAGTQPERVEVPAERTGPGPRAPAERVGLEVRSGFTVRFEEVDPDGTGG